MKVEQADIIKIKNAFAKMESKEEFLQLLNEAKPLVYGEKAVPFQLKQLTWYANPKLAKNRYIEFKIKKKSGEDRTINAPVEGLKAIQKTLSFVLQCVFEPHKAAHGFVREKSIVDNAKIHAGSRYVYNIDLKDFFPSVDQARVWKCLQLKPFNLIDANKINVEESLEISSRLGYKLYQETNAIAKQVILLINYENTLLKSGSFYLKLKAGGIIPYMVKVDTSNNLNGTIRINISKSNLKPIKESLNSKNEGASETTHDEIITVIFELIKYHFAKKISKDNRQNLANMIASLCCTEMEVERKNDIGEWKKVNRNVLPQGAPTSPILTNVICHRLDYLLSAVAKRFGLKYSRYADDITFSSMHNVFQENSAFLNEIHRIISEQGFHIKASKTRLQKEGFRQEVTGLLVNEKANVQKRYIKQLREWLYKWETYGYDKSNIYFTQKYIQEKGYVKDKIPNMSMVIDGKLQYLKMVKGEKNKTYLTLKNRFDQLINFKEKPKTRIQTNILDLIFEVGLDDAMKQFKI